MEEGNLEGGGNVGGRREEKVKLEKRKKGGVKSEFRWMKRT